MIITGKLVILAKGLQQCGWQSIPLDFSNIHGRHSETRGKINMKQSSPRLSTAVLHRNQTWLTHCLSQPPISIFKFLWPQVIACWNRWQNLIADPHTHIKKKKNPKQSHTMNQSFKRLETAEGECDASGIKNSSPHCVGGRDSLLQEFIQSRKMGEPLMARAGVQQYKPKQNSITQPGTTLQLMERGFGNPSVQQHSPAQECHVPRHWMHRCSWYLLCRRQEQSETLLLFVSEDEWKFN